MIIDPTYFISEINIAQLGQPYVAENLQFFIDKYEKIYLVKVFGFEMARDFRNGLEADPIEERWTNLTNKLQSDDKISPIANFVYYYYSLSEHTFRGGYGDQLPKAENSEVVTPDYKIVQAWNDMIELTNELVDWVKSSNDYPEYVDKKPFEVINTFNL